MRVILAIDWMNNLSRAHEVLDRGRRTSIKYPGDMIRNRSRPHPASRVYPERMLTALLGKVRELTDKDTEIIGRVYTNVQPRGAIAFNVLTEACYAFGFSLLTAPARIRPSDPREPWTAEPDPVDAVMIKDIRELTRSGEVMKVFICSADQDFLDLATELAKKGIGVRVLTIADIYDPQHPLGNVRDTIREAVGEVHGVDPTYLCFNDSSTLTVDAALERAERDVVVRDFLNAAIATIAQLTTPEAKLSVEELLGRAWRALINPWVTYGFTKLLLNQLILFLMNPAHPRREEGYLDGSRTTDARDATGVIVQKTYLVWQHRNPNGAP